MQWPYAVLLFMFYSLDAATLLGDFMSFLNRDWDVSPTPPHLGLQIDFVSALQECKASEISYCITHSFFSMKSRPPCYLHSAWAIIEIDAQPPSVSSFAVPLVITSFRIFHWLWKMTFFESSTLQTLLCFSLTVSFSPLVAVSSFLCLMAGSGAPWHVIPITAISQVQRVTE